MTKITISKCGYSVAVNGSIVINDARTKDAAFNEACSILASLEVVGINAVILNSRGEKL